MDLVEGETVIVQLIQEDDGSGDDRHISMFPYAIISFLGYLAYG